MFNSKRCNFKRVKRKTTTEFRSKSQLTQVILVILFCFPLSTTFAQELKAFDTNRLKELISQRSDTTTFEIEEIIDINRNSAHDTTFYKTLLLSRDHFRRIGDPNRSIRYGEELIELARKMERYDQLGQHYSYLNHQYWLLGDFEKQYEASTNGEYYAVKYKDTTSWILSLTSFSRLLFKIDEFDAAITYNKRAFTLNQQYLKYDQRASLLRSRCVYLYESDRFPEALEAIQESQKYAYRNYDTALYYNMLGTVYYLMDSLDTAEDAFDTLLSIVSEKSRNDVIQSAYYFKGLIYFKRGIYPLAKEYLNKALSGFGNIRDLDLKQKLFDALYDVAEAENNINDANYYLKQSKSLSDSLSPDKKLKELAKDYYHNVILKKDAEKKLAKRDATLASRKASQEKVRRMYTTIGLVATAIVLIVLLFVFLRYRRSQHKNRQRMKRQFSDSIELKNKELASMHVQRMQRTNNMQEVDSKISEISDKISTQPSGNMGDLEIELKRVKQMLQADARLNWDDFRYYFEQINNDFFDRIRKRHPNITTHDEKIIAYIKIGLDNKQIADLLNVTQKTVHMQRYRLRKKFEIDRKTDLRRYLEDEFG